jgi:hypothetical protein
MFDVENENVKKLKINPIKVISAWEKERKIINDWVHKVIHEEELDNKVPFEVYMAVCYYNDHILKEKIWHIEEMLLICSEDNN